MTVGELGRRMSLREFGEWIAFYSHEAGEQKRVRDKAEQAARMQRRRR